MVLEVSRVNSLTRFTVVDLGVRRTYSLNDDTYFIGRNFDNTIRLKDECVSKYHARISRVKDKNAPLGYIYLLEDGGNDSVGSTNGTEVNGRRISSHILKPGDCIKFGPNCSAFYSEINLEGGQDEDSTVFVEPSTVFVEPNRPISTPTPSLLAPIAKDAKHSLKSLKVGLVITGVLAGSLLAYFSLRSLMSVLRPELIGYETTEAVASFELLEKSIPTNAARCFRDSSEFKDGTLGTASCNLIQEETLALSKATTAIEEACMDGAISRRICKLLETRISQVNAITTAVSEGSLLQADYQEGKYLSPMQSAQLRASIRRLSNLAPLERQ
ncbi:MAG: FHA domain-containing protein [Synechococcus sp.]